MISIDGLWSEERKGKAVRPRWSEGFQRGVVGQASGRADWAKKERLHLFAGRNPT
jgi:hypothetical protein